MAAKKKGVDRRERHKTVAKAKSAPAPRRLSELSGRATQIASHVLNSIAFDRYADCCSLEALAEAFGTTAGLLRPTLRKCEEAGLITLKGNLHQTVYPTQKLL